MNGTTIIKSVLLFLVLGMALTSTAQVYLEKQTRHRFAQLTLGMDLQGSFGGTARYLNSQGNISSFNLESTFTPRFLIGGTHFWGHADFYIAIPLLEPTLTRENQKVTALRDVETVFKFYPYRIKHNQLRPYIGTSLAPFYYEQENQNFEYSSGPELVFRRFPLLGGLTYNSGSHLFELGFAWNYDNQQRYYVARGRAVDIETPPLFITLGYKFLLETTLSAERDWESGRTERVTRELAKDGGLNSWYFGVGISSAFWLDQNTYNWNNRRYIGTYTSAITADFTLGYYFHQPDINVALGYRGYGTSTDTYGVIQNLRRRSFLLEATKYLFDYHGFAPFLGPTVSYENLKFREEFEGDLTYNLTQNKLGYGLTVGWDIRPNRIQSWLLRTNLRWYPDLYLEVDPNSRVGFDNIEFNFIQLIIFPERMF